MQGHTVDPQHHTWPRLLAWLLAFSGIVILALQCATPISSYDLWWHMAFGRHILATGQFTIDHSIFTWTYATPYLIYNAWLSEVALYLVYAKTGAVGLIVLRYLVHGGFFALAAYFAMQRGVAANPLTWVIISIGVVLAFMAQSVQPELFSFAFMCIAVWLYFSIRARGVMAWQRCYWFPIIVVLWINSHGGFVMSAFFFASVGIGELLNTRFSPHLALPSKLRTHLFIALALCVPALLLNPFGYALPLHLLHRTTTFSSDIKSLSGVIVGWEPTAKYNNPPYYALDYLLMAMTIYVFLIWQRLKHEQTDWVVILAFITYSFIFINTVRTTHFLAPVFVFASLDLLAHKANSWAWPRAQMAKMAIMLSSIALVGVIGWRTVQGTICHPSFGNLWTDSSIAAFYPAEEAEYIRHRPEIKRLGNTYNDGGYLMYQLWPSVLHMIDQRYYPFTSWFDQYTQFVTGADIPHFMDAHKADAWLIPHDNAALIEWFANSKAWVPWFIGPGWVVFGSASGSSIKTTISPNINSIELPPTLLALFHTALELHQWSLAERIRAHIASIATKHLFCGEKYYVQQHYAGIAKDMQIAITATRAFYNGDYATASASLRLEVPFLYLKDIAVLAHTIMAKRAWDNSNYALARALAIDALKISPKNIVSVYNAAIADWQYRKSAIASKAQVSDDIAWQNLLDILLTHKEQLPQNITAIIDVLSAMQQGTLVAKPEFIIQH